MWGEVPVVKQFARLFNRYAMRHLPMTYTRTGWRIEVRNGQVTITGTAPDAKRITVTSGLTQRRAQRQNGGIWRVDLPFAPQGQIKLLIDHASGVDTLVLHRPAQMRVLWATARLLPQFCARALGALPDAIRWYRDRNPAARVAVRNRLGLAPNTTAMGLPDGLFQPQAVPEASGVTIIMPVYNGFEILREALARVRQNTDVPWRLILIEDVSTDARVLPFLRDFAATETRCTLIENATNLGFVGAVNRGFEAAAACQKSQSDWPVVLLNSDALVPPNWAARLLAPLSDPQVASVTPMSNDAELMTVPTVCRPVSVDPRQADAIDARITQLAAPTLEADLPTGVGFCMALSPTWLRRIGYFDLKFGKGYGEEVDWCQKAQAAGARNVAQTNLFVAHQGGASFGPAQKNQLIAQNRIELSRRYPNFDAQVQSFIASDPLLGHRLAHALAWAGSHGRVPIYLAHDMGGGAEADLRRRIAADGIAVVVRVGGAHRWQIAVHGGPSVLRVGTEDTALLLDLLTLIPDRHIIYVCAVGDPDPIALPDVLMDLARGQKLSVLLHDYFTCTPAYNLLTERGAYRGMPSLAAASRADTLRRLDGTQVTLDDWRAAWGALLRAADRVIAFSKVAADLVREAYPDLTNIAVVPHALITPVTPVPRPIGAGALGILGNLNHHKGADVVRGLSHHAQRGNLVILGEVAPGVHLGRVARVHGRYAVSELAELVAKYHITRWFIPSIWPETFSFTTHEALATGLPVYAFDLGAQGAAVTAARAAGGQGGVFPLGTPAVKIAAEILPQMRPKRSWF